jgi:ribonuclease R
VNEIEESIIKLLSGSADKPLGFQEIRRELNIPKSKASRLRNCLSKMVHNGTLVRTRSSGYRITNRGDLYEGVLHMLRSGNSFVSVESIPNDVFVAREYSLNAMPGDKVRIQVPPDEAQSEKPEGRVVEVVERIKRDVVATLKKQGKAWFAIPLNPSYQNTFVVTDTLNAADGDRVVVRIDEWDNPKVSPEAAVIDVIGPAEDASLDTLAIIRQFDFPETFPPEVIEEAEKAAFIEDEAREDIRSTLVITIDPERARDFDDALSMERDNNGNRVLGIHIADVSHFVPIASELDKEALKRGNSVYLPDRVIPMLPEQLSNGICSLRPDEDRHAFSAFLTLDQQCKVLSSRFAKTMIRSQRRLTYEQAMAAIEQGQKGADFPDGITKNVGQLIMSLHQVAQQLRRARFSRYALDLDIPEFEVKMGANSMIEDIVKSVHDESHQLVEECMIAANEAVDRHLTTRQIPIIHRFHSPPREEKLDDLIIQLIEMGFSPGNIKNQKNLSKFLKSIHGHPLEYDASMLILRSMNRAEYSAEEHGHYGLAKVYYAHFTSPIRRYADLVVHRLLHAQLTKEQLPYKQQRLSAISRAISKTEQTAEEAERILVEIKKYRFLAQQLEQGKPLEYEAVITNIQKFGFFVELLQLSVHGLVHVSTLGNKRVRYIPKEKMLKSGAETWERGQKVMVYVTNVDFEERQLDFALCQ